MSYVRWSTPIPLTEDCPICRRPAAGFGKTDPIEEWLAADKYQRRWADGPWYTRAIFKFAWWRTSEIKPKTLRSRLFWWGKKCSRGLCKTCTSPWYIYHDCSSGETLESQLLAVWAAGGESLPLVPYPEIKRVLAERDFDSLDGFAANGDCGVLARSLEDWIANMEDEFAGEACS